MSEDSVHVEIDERTPSWAAILDKDRFREELDRLCRVEWNFGAVETVHVGMLRMHKNRCTFDIEFKTKGGLHSLIGKVHDIDRSDIFQAMKDIVNSGFGPEAEFAIARPMAYLPSLHLLLEEKITGMPGKESLLKASPDEQRTLVERSGAWLARFHSSSPGSGRALEPREQLLSHKKWNDAIGASGEPFASKCQALLQKLDSVAPAPHNLEYRAGHGSYMPDHVFSTGSRTVVIDLDEHDLADPARDLSTFIVSLKRLGLKQLNSLQAFDHVAESFLAAYAAHGPPRALEHLSFYKAALFLHKAQRDLYKWSPPFRERAEIMLDEGFRAVRIN